MITIYNVLQYLYSLHFDERAVKLVRKKYFKLWRHIFWWRVFETNNASVGAKLNQYNIHFYVTLVYYVHYKLFLIIYR